jgi:hypothetical protein
MSNQFQEAFKRAFWGGLLIGLGIFFTSLQVEVRTRDTVEDAAIAGVVALITYITFRGGVEGWIDTQRNQNGNIIPADVGAFQEPLNPNVYKK